jgi:hypothetical protein
MEGAESKMSFIKRVAAANLLRWPNSARKMPHKMPMGVPIKRPKSVIIRLPKMALRKPPSMPGGGVSSVKICVPKPLKPS